MKKIIGTALLAILAGAAGCGDSPDEAQPTGATLILTNARVYTLDWEESAPDGTLSASAPHDGTIWSPDAEAVVTEGDEIVFVGSTRDALSYAGEDTRVVDLAGATVIPGLVDSHTHVFGLGAALDRVNLVDIETEEDAVALIVERARTVPEGEWIVGRGWDEGAWANRYPDKALLTEAVPNHPVFMGSLHGFAGWGQPDGTGHRRDHGRHRGTCRRGNAPWRRRRTQWAFPESCCAVAQLGNPRAFAGNTRESGIAGSQSNGAGWLHGGTRCGSWYARYVRTRGT